jgi:hypothetical protein
MAVVGSYIAGGIADLVLRKHDGGTSEAKKQRINAFGKS